MFKEFAHHIAWTDVMRDGGNFVGLIEIQHKFPFALVQALWVISPHAVNERQAENAAIAMLENINEITRDGNVIYSDGVVL